MPSNGSDRGSGSEPVATQPIDMAAILAALGETVDRPH